MKPANESKKVFLYAKWITRISRQYTGYIIAILLLDSFGGLSRVFTAVLSKNLIDNSVQGHTSKALMYAAAFGCLIAANLGVQAILSIISVKAKELMSNRIRETFFRLVCSTQWIHVSKHHSGDILTRLTSDINTVTSCVISTFPGIISLGLQFTAAFLILMYYEPAMAVLAFILGPLSIVSSRIWGRKLKQFHIKVQESESSYRSFIQESIENILIIKAFRMENVSRENLDRLHRERMKWIIQKNKTGVAAGTVFGTGYWAGYFLAFCWGSLKLGIGKTTFGTLTAFLQLVEQVQGPFIGLSGTLPQVIAAFGSAGRLIELESMPGEEEGGTVTVINTPVGISINDVTYSYPGGNTILDNASARIPPGGMVALVGGSGEGKTTLVRLIIALVKPDKGEVVFEGPDGVRLNASVSARAMISYVPQGNTLFSGTIAENLRAGNPAATQSELEDGIAAACAAEFISTLPDGINTVIGEKGVGLSEGQVQRIAIARALIRKTPLIIFDEATSSLDLLTELKVLQNLKKIQPPRTCIVITHRTAALNICSRVLQLKGGKLIENNKKGALMDCIESA